MIATRVDNTQDVLDSRDIIKRIEVLESEIESCGGVHALGSRGCGHGLEALLELQEDAQDAADWDHGAELIRDTYFTEYAQELAQDLAEDIGEIVPGAFRGWPLAHIDWEAAAEALTLDYTDVEFDGVTYWVRDDSPPHVTNAGRKDW